jgi:hypothetical protein
MRSETGPSGQGRHVPLPHGPLTCKDNDPRMMVLRCIQLQVLKWTHNMPCDMIYLDSFFDAVHRDLVASDGPPPASACKNPSTARTRL